MKIIIVGCGKVGQTLAEQLDKEGNDITVIDRNQSVIEELAGRCDLMYVAGDAINHEVQQEAGVEQADLFIAVTDSDERNLLCCLIAKKVGNCQTIARVRSPEYMKETRFIKDELRLAMVINPEYAAASEISRVFRFPSAIKIETFAKGRMELLKFRIQENSVLKDMRVMDMGKQLKCDVLVCAVERGEEVFIPGGDFILRGRDVISIVATPKNASNFFKKIGIQTHQIRDAMIVGGGGIAYYLATILITMGIKVKILEKQKKRCEELNEMLPKATILHADAVEQSVLMEEGMEQAEGFAALTDMDEENILLSLFAKNCSKAKVVTKINKIAFDEVINRMDLDTIVYPKNITAEYIIWFVRAMKNSLDSNVECVYRIIENKAEALEFKIRENSPVIGHTLLELKLKKNILVAGITRKGVSIIPRGNDEMMVGDTVIIVTTHMGFTDIKDILDNGQTATFLH